VFRQQWFKEILFRSGLKSDDQAAHFILAAIPKRRTTLADAITTHHFDFPSSHLSLALALKEDDLAVLATGCPVHQ
jgi:hypothetical protein